MLKIFCLQFFFLFIISTGCTTSSIDKKIDIPTSQPKLVDNKTPDYYYIMAEHFILNNQIAKAIEYLEKAISQKPYWYEAHLKLIRLYLSSNQISNAQTLLNKLPAKIAEQKEYAIFQATIFYVNREFNKAIPALQLLIKKHPDYEPSYLLLADIYDDQKQENKAYQVYQDLKKAIPSSYLATKRLGTYHLVKKQYKEAEVYFLDSLSKNRKDSETNRLTGLLYETIKDNKKAIQYYEEAQKYSDNNLALMERQIDLYLQLGQKRDSIKLLLKVHKLFPTNTNIQLVIGLVYFDLEEYSKAEEFLRPLNSTNLKEQEKFNFYFGVTLANLKKYEEALQYLEKISNTSEYVQGSYSTRVKVLINQQEHLKAVQLLNSSPQQVKNSVLYYKLLSQIYMEQQLYEKAISVSLEGHKQYPTSVDILSDLVIYYERLKQYDQLIQFLKKTVQLRPDNAVLLNFLGYTYAENNTELPQAKDYLLKALSLDPDNGYYQDSLGWIYFRMNRVDEAMKLLETANEKMPNESEILIHLGEVYYAKGLLVKALDCFRKALSVERSQKLRKMILQKIESYEKQYETI